MHLQSKYLSGEVKSNLMFKCQIGRVKRKKQQLDAKLYQILCNTLQQSGLDCRQQRLTLNEAVSHAKQQDSQQSSGEKQQFSAEIKNFTKS